MRILAYILLFIISASFLPENVTKTRGNVIYNACITGYYNSILINNFDKHRSGVNRVNPVGSWEPYTISGAVYGLMVWYPDDYFTNPTRRYPVIIMQGGGGEVGSNPALSYKYGPGYFIQNGIWDGKVVVGDSTYDPIYVAYQTPVIRTSPQLLKRALDTIDARYRTDTMRKYFTGLSMGGQTIDHLLTYYGGLSGITNYTANRGFTAVFAMSTPKPDIPATSLDTLVRYLELGSYDNMYTNIIGVGDNTAYVEPQDILPFNNIYPTRVRSFKYVAAGKPYAGSCASNGHCGWNAFYNPAWRDTILNQSIYQGFLAKTRRPFATIADTLYTSVPSYTLAAKTNGWNRVITWTQVSGPTTTITTPSNDTTNVDGLVSGTYQYNIRVRNGVGPTYSDKVVTVISTASEGNTYPAPILKKKTYQKVIFKPRNA